MIDRRSTDDRLTNGRPAPGLNAYPRGPQKEDPCLFAVSFVQETAAGVTRRDLFKTGSLLALGLLLGKRAVAAPAEARFSRLPRRRWAHQIGPNPAVDGVRSSTAPAR